MRRNTITRMRTYASLHVCSSVSRYFSNSSSPLIPSFDVCVIGSGLVGLSTAVHLLMYDKQREQQIPISALNPASSPPLSPLRVCVLEKCSSFSSHQSSRNSGVLHAGVYYQPGSNRAKLCKRGGKLLADYCNTNNVPWRRTGKLIVATEEGEFQRLAALQQRGQANGVEGLQIIEGADAIAKLEPNIHGLRALLVPSTGIVDFPSLAASFVHYIERMGGQLINGFQVDKVKGMENVTANGQSTRVCADDDDGHWLYLSSSAGSLIRCRHVINCAGLYADKVAALFGGSQNPPIIPFRGRWLQIQSKYSHLIERNIYPVPNPQFPFLGVHFTPTLDNRGQRILIGPTATLALAREGYLWSDVNIGELLAIFRCRAFQRLAAQHWRFGVRQMSQELMPALFLWKEITRYMPGLKYEQLEFDSVFCGLYRVPAVANGVRAQALDDNGQFIEDFLFEPQGDRVLHIRNAPSPAATSSIAIGEEIVKMAVKTFRWGKQRNEGIEQNERNTSTQE